MPPSCRWARKTVAHATNRPLPFRQCSTRQPFRFFKLTPHVSVGQIAKFGGIPDYFGALIANIPLSPKTTSALSSAFVLPLALLFTFDSVCLSAKAGGAGGISFAVRVGASHHVRGGGTVLLPVGTPHQAVGGEGRHRPDTARLPHPLHLLLGASGTRCLLPLLPVMFCQ